MFRLQYVSAGRVVILGVGLFLGLGGWAQTELAGAEQIRPRAGDVAKAKQNPQDAAATDFVARRLPGNENVWYVVVLRGKSGNAKGGITKTIQVSASLGKTAAAVHIVKFLQQHPNIARNPQSYTHWLQVEMYPTEQLALLRCQAISTYVRQGGYR